MVRLGRFERPTFGSGVLSVLRDQPPLTKQDQDNIDNSPIRYGPSWAGSAGVFGQFSDSEPRGNGPAQWFGSPMFPPKLLVRNRQFGCVRELSERHRQPVIRVPGLIARTGAW